MSVRKPLFISCHLNKKRDSEELHPFLVFVAKVDGVIEAIIFYSRMQIKDYFKKNMEEFVLSGELVPLAARQWIDQFMPSKSDEQAIRFKGKTAEIVVELMLETIELSEMLRTSQEEEGEEQEERCEDAQTKEGNLLWTILHNQNHVQKPN